jgi:hypothetical protein
MCVLLQISCWGRANRRDSGVYETIWSYYFYQFSIVIHSLVSIRSVFLESGIDKDASHEQQLRGAKVAKAKASAHLVILHHLNDAIDAQTETSDGEH